MSLTFDKNTQTARERLAAGCLIGESAAKGHGVATAAPVVSLRKGAPVRGVGGGDGQAPGLEGPLRPEK